MIRVLIFITGLQFVFFSNCAFACGSPYYLVNRTDPRQLEAEYDNFYNSRPIFSRNGSNQVFNDFSLPIPSDACVETTANCNPSQLLFDLRVIKWLFTSRDIFCSDTEYEEMRHARK